MIGELIPTGVTFGVGRNSINDQFSGTGEFNNIILESGADFSGGTGGGVIYSGGTDLYNIFSTGGGGTSANLFSASTGANSIISNNGTGNVASGNTSISIGWGNNATGTLATVVGGAFNLTTNQYASIFGGNNNTVTGDRSSIVCGEQNTISSWNSFIAGGYYNSAVTGAYSSVIAGLQNMVTGTRSSIIGSSALTNPYDDTVMLTNLRAAENGGVIYSAGTDLYNIFSTGGSSATASDGLTKTVDNITLGGAITGNTILDVGSSSATFLLSGDANNSSQIRILTNFGSAPAFMSVSRGSARLRGENTTNTDRAEITISNGVAPAGSFSFSNASGLKGITISDADFSITDTHSSKGIDYTANYHTNYTNRTLVDKEYVDNTVATGNTNTAFDYGTTGGTLNWDQSADSSSAKVIFSGNVTLNVLNATSGEFGTLRIQQDGVGSRTLTLGAGTHKVANGGSGSITLTSTAGAIDIITFFYDGSEFNWSAGYNYT